MRLDGPLAKRHRAQRIGDGDQIVIFSHGFGTGQAVWQKIVRQLPDRISAFLFDLSGAGPHLPRDFRLEDYQSLQPFADELLALLDEANIDRCLYVGHSVSGVIGMLAAVQAPEKFEKLILLNTSPRYLDDGDYSGGFTAAEVDGLIWSMETNYQAWVTGFAPMAICANVPSAIEDFSDDLLAMRPDIAAKIAQLIFTSDYRDLLPQVTTPTHLIHSRSDIAVPEAVAHYLEEHIPDSRLYWIDAKGHLPHISAPNEVLGALLTCIDA